ncbi:hypothetical protein PPYR_07461 [Photinus pyralis]|uniref:Uncharacterized protein n=1 Tax=Photinus pyralis TaxID=7054 RepID=A0A1Y1JZ92_PHOPY|nr:hypothetical protein PPYR_07461 [Photinus pyralis]
MEDTNTERNLQWKQRHTTASLVYSRVKYAKQEEQDVNCHAKAESISQQLAPAVHITKTYKTKIKLQENFHSRDSTSIPHQHTPLRIRWAELKNGTQSVKVDTAPSFYRCYKSSKMKIEAVS